MFEPVNCHQNRVIMLLKGFEREARAEFQPTCTAGAQTHCTLNPGAHGLNSRDVVIHQTQDQGA